MDKPGRNDPCPCGSGKKFKKCCGKNVSSMGFTAKPLSGKKRAENTTQKVSQLGKSNLMQNLFSKAVSGTIPSNEQNKVKGASLKGKISKGAVGRSLGSKITGAEES